MHQCLCVLFSVKKLLLLEKHQLFSVSFTQKRFINCSKLFLTNVFLLKKFYTEVSCVFQESCILPCSFQGSTDAVISWSLLKARHVSILSYNSKQDQLTQQDEHFRGRASLFKDQISNGNASLQLTSVELQDEGRYKCATGGNNDSFISLKVDAPVREVNIEKAENRITCSSEGIYPEPVLTWSTSRQTVFRSTTIVQQSGPNRELYNIKSSVIFPDTKHDFTDMTYSCTVSTRSNHKTAILSNRVIMIAVILGLIPICCNKFNSKVKTNKQISGRVSTSEFWGSVVLMC
uniref:Ig-like domain-containing protein n=1 Tax=Neolamprologus brichardi TaxID=32507 RepID=A0A3Q4GNU7_NEOBR